MTARIYRPRKSAMQSGRAKTERWVLEFDNSGSRTTDPLMGWTSSADTSSQIRLTFDTREEAIAHAKRENLTFVVEDTREPKRLVKSYSENFAHDRKQPWTH